MEELAEELAMQGPQRELRDFCRSAPDPLALLLQNGTILLVNEPMDRQLSNAPDAARLLQSVARPESPRSLRINTAEASGRHTHLLRLPLGQMVLVTLIEDLDDPRLAQLKRRLEQAEKQSVTDTLTGAWNRLQFEQVARSEIPRAERYGQPLSLVILDIDHFKRVNDTHGHQAGDQVLRSLVNILRSGIRVMDSLFRWGGEEFAVMLPNSALNSARLTAERLRQAVMQHDFETVGAVTISAGIAELNRGEVASVWFERADRALYAAKAAGRNRVLCAADHPQRRLSASDEHSPLLMPWKAAYESGHPLIDSQHQRLFELGNRLISASLDPDTPKSELLALMDELIEHVRRHFADEEAILETIAYEGYDAHKRAHRGLLDRALELRSRAVSDSISSGEVIDFLVSNLVRKHMLSADQAFFRHLLPEAVSE